ncbi:MAG: lysoplasmalogenase [Cyclobacteriaceae bacterium]|jgi:uncharacterized membrane protein YhhN
MSNYKTYKILILFFWINALIHVLSILLNLYLLTLITKPLIMPILAGVFFFKTRDIERQVPVSYLYLAILFSFFGDVLLIFMDQGEIWFSTGLAAFLLAQVFYSITYRHYRYEKSNVSGKAIKMVYSLIIIAYAIILWINLYPHLGDMLLPVTLYTLTILVMVIMAIFRDNRTSRLSFYLVFSGAVIFLVSDSMIAINKFMVPVPYERLLVISTYMIAQFLIISGLAEHLNLKKDQA